MLLRLLTALLLVTALGSCADQSSNYYPLAPGFSWRYNIELTTMDGVEQQKYVVATDAPRVWQERRLPVRRTLDGTRVFYRNDDTGIYRVASQRRDASEPTALPEERQIVLRKPLQPGTSWRGRTETITLARTGPPQRSEYEIAASMDMEYVIESVDASVTVPAGRFDNCLRVSGQGQRRNYDAGNYIGPTDISIDKTDWYAPGVGLVKSVREESTSGRVLNQGEMQTFSGKVVFELEAFDG